MMVDDAVVVVVPIPNYSFSVAFLVFVAAAAAAPSSVVFFVIAVIIFVPLLMMLPLRWMLLL